jgi:hypothetical protein
LNYKHRKPDQAMMTAMVMMTAIRPIVEIDQTTAHAQMPGKKKSRTLPGTASRHPKPPIQSTEKLKLP